MGSKIGFVPPNLRVGGQRDTRRVTCLGLVRLLSSLKDSKGQAGKLVVATIPDFLGYQALFLYSYLY
jgi:hypothetical protein